MLLTHQEESSAAALELSLSLLTLLYGKGEEHSEKDPGSLNKSL